MSTTTAIQTPATPVIEHEAPAPRYDLYTGIHKGLRAWMSDVLMLAGRMDPFDATELDEFAGKLRALLRVCRKHIEHENKYVHGAMERAIPGTSGEVVAEHVHHEEEIARIETALTGLERAEWTARPAAAQGLYRRLALFVAENFVHMNREETAHNAVLWSTYTDLELAEIEQTIVASLSPDEMAEILRRMVPAISAPERAAMFTGMRLNAPGEVVDQLLAIVKPHLSNRDWIKLCEATGPFP